LGFCVLQIHRVFPVGVAVAVVGVGMVGVGVVVVVVVVGVGPVVVDGGCVETRLIASLPRNHPPHTD